MVLLMDDGWHYNNQLGRLCANEKMRCKNVYHINGVGVDTSRYHECQIDRETYRKSLGLSENDIAILEVGELSTRKIIRSLLMH